MSSLHCGSENWEYREAHRVANDYKSQAIILRALAAERDALRAEVQEMALQALAEAGQEAEEFERRARAYEAAATASLIAQRDSFKQALESIADQDPVDAALDPDWAIRVARAVLKSQHPAA